MDSTVNGVGYYCGVGKEITGWDVTCCKCIVEQTSKGNANFQRDDTLNGSVYIGLFGINSINWELCGDQTLTGK